MNSSIRSALQKYSAKQSGETAFASEKTQNKRSVTYFAIIVGIVILIGFFAVKLNIFGAENLWQSFCDTISIDESIGEAVSGIKENVISVFSKENDTQPVNNSGQSGTLQL